jgi:hypothetical protein
LNLSLKVWFEKSLKKKKRKRKLTFSPSCPGAKPPTNLLPAAAHAPGSFSFLFVSLTSRPHRSVPPRRLPFFFPPLLRPARRRRKSRRARPPSPSFPPRPSRPIKAVNPRIQIRLFPLSPTPTRDARGLQWQVVGRRAPSIPLLPPFAPI